MTNILVVVDGSDQSLRAVGWARELARTAPHPVFHLLHAYSAPVPMFKADVPRCAALWERAEADGARLLERAAAEVEGAVTHLHLVRGPALDAAQALVERVEADLVAVGSVGRCDPGAPGTPGPGAPGLDMAELTPHLRTPVLVAGSASPRPVRRVLVGVDGSDYGVRALEFAAHWGSAAEVVGLCVVQLPFWILDAPAATEPATATVVEQAAHAVLQRTPALAQTASSGVMTVPRVHVRSSAGGAASELAAEFHSGCYDLAVVGRRGLGAPTAPSLGRVSERLLGLAPGPVVVVP